MEKKKVMITLLVVISIIVVIVGYNFSIEKKKTTELVSKVEIEKVDFYSKETKDLFKNISEYVRIHYW